MSTRPRWWARSRDGLGRSRIRLRRARDRSPRTPSRARQRRLSFGVPRSMPGLARHCFPDRTGHPEPWRPIMTRGSRILSASLPADRLTPGECVYELDVPAKPLQLDSGLTDALAEVDRIAR